MSAKTFVFGVDLDGTVADFYGGLRPIAAEWLGRAVDDLTLEVSWGLPEWGIDKHQAATKTCTSSLLLNESSLETWHPSLALRRLCVACQRRMSAYASSLIGCSLSTSTTSQFSKPLLGWTITGSLIGISVL